MKIIAEIGINHNGSLDLAKQLIRMAKECGADLVKFQKRTVEVCYSKEYLDSPRESPWGSTQRAQKEGLEFGFSDFKVIDDYCKELKIPWFASAWDIPSLEFLDCFDLPLHKIASPMLTNIPFLAEVAKRGKTTIISTGMSDWANVNRAAGIFMDGYCPFVLMHCVSEYPCPDEDCNLAMIPRIISRFPAVEVGYSNHSPGIESCVGAAYLGAEWIECHVTLDRSMYGSDQAASLERRGLELVCKYTRNAKKIIGDGIKIIRKAEMVNAKKLRYWEAI